MPDDRTAAGEIISNFAARLRPELPALYSAEELLRAAAYGWNREGHTCLSPDGSYSTVGNQFLELAERAVLDAEGEIDATPPLG